MENPDVVLIGDALHPLGVLREKHGLPETCNLLPDQAAGAIGADDLVRRQQYVNAGGLCRPEFVQ
jgi:hypothetical protein